MIDIQPLHKPRWQQDGDDWVMIVGNRSVAALIWNPGDRNFPHLVWLSRILAQELNDFGWYNVDFDSLEIAQYEIEQWWHQASRGVRYNPHLHCDRPSCGCRTSTLGKGRGAKRKLHTLPTLRSRACALLRLFAAAPRVSRLSLK